MKRQRKPLTPMLLAAVSFLTLWTAGGCGREVPRPYVQVFSDEEEPQPQRPLLIAPPLPTRARYLALGDSCTIGMYVDASERYPVQLAAALRGRGIDMPDPAILAQTGWTVEELMAAMDKETFEPSYDLVTVGIGVNNQYRGNPVEAFRPELQTLLTRAIRLAGGHPGRVIVVSILDWSVLPFAEGRDRQKIAREIDAYNAVCREEASAGGMQFVDVTAVSHSNPTGPGPVLVAADGLHPSSELYRLWCELLAPVAAGALQTQAEK